jgi:glutaredoxin
MGPATITVLGSTTCEDSAIVSSRLRALGVPFLDVDIDADPAAARRVSSLNDGRRVTPTLVVGDDAVVRAEPTLEALGELLQAAGHDVRPPRATDYHGDLITRSIPVRTLVGDRGARFSLDQLRGRRQVALFLAHAADCLPCFGYARQLAGSYEALTQVDTLPLVVVAGDVRAADAWRHGIDDAVMILADPDGAWKRAVATHVRTRAEDAILLLLDRFGAPRAGSGAEEAGGLIDPSAAVEWLRVARR